MRLGRRLAVAVLSVVCVFASTASAVSVPQGSAVSSTSLLKPIKSIRDLHGRYSDIFKTNNRNAASHLWISHVLERAPSMTRAEVEKILTGFCAVSGSPVSPHDYNRKGCLEEPFVLFFLSFLANSKCLMSDDVGFAPEQSCGSA